jgi:hypothetical protein
MDKFQPGEEVYVRLVFQNAMPIRNAYIVFVHQDDKKAHIVLDFKGADEEKPIQPTSRRLLDIATVVPKEQKPGIYALDRINFKTFSENTLDYRGDIVPPKFEVIPEHEAAPIVQDVSIFTKMHWDAIKRRDAT